RGQSHRRAVASGSLRIRWPPQKEAPSRAHQLDVRFPRFLLLYRRRTRRVRTHRIRTQPQQTPEEPRQSRRSQPLAIKAPRKTRKGRRRSLRIYRASPAMMGAGFALLPRESVGYDFTLKPGRLVRSERYAPLKSLTPTIIGTGLCHVTLRPRSTTAPI